MASTFLGSGPARFSNGWQSFETAHAAALQAKQMLQAAGVRVPPSGRLNKYIRQLSLVEKVTPTTTKLPRKLDLERLHRALADTAELNLIAEQLSASPFVDGWTPKAHLAMKGDARPSEEQSNSGAWDYQFELLMAAFFRRAGYDITVAEPDVVITTDHGPVGVAAKRSHSWANLDDLVSKADFQILQTGHIGILALDVSYLTNPTDQFVPSVGRMAGLQDVRMVVDGFLQQNHPRMLRCVNPRVTIGVIVYASALAIDMAAPRFAVARGSVFGNFCSMRDPNLALFTNIRQRLSVAI